MDLVPFVMIAALLSGAVAGLFLGTFGGGGSVLAAPLLIYAVGVADPHMAIGTCAAAVAAIAAVSLIGQWRAKRVKWPHAGAFALAGIAGSVGGSQLALRVDGTWLLLAFAVAAAAIGLSMFRRPKGLGDRDVHISAVIMARILPLGLLTGLAAGFFGIGGGFLIVPGLMMATGMTLSNAMASSLVSAALFGTTTSANYAIAGQVDWPLVALLLAGGAIGGVAGVQVARALAERTALARKGFAAMIVGVAGYVGWNAVLGIAATS